MRSIWKMEIMEFKSPYIYKLDKDIPYFFDCIDAVEKFAEKYRILSYDLFQISLREETDF